jgi:hypothetical protein
MSFSARDWLNGATDSDVHFVQVSALKSQVWLIDTRLHFLGWPWRWRHCNLLKPWLFAQRHSVIIQEKLNLQQLGCEYFKSSTWYMSSLKLWFVFSMPHWLCVSIHSAYVDLYAVGSQSHLIYCVLSEINFLCIILEDLQAVFVRFIVLYSLTNLPYYLWVSILNIQKCFLITVKHASRYSFKLTVFLTYCKPDITTLISEMCGLW